jgi:hypothetical protein
VQRQQTLGRGDIAFHQRRLVRGQAIDDQIYRLGAAPHHLLQQSDEQLGVQPTLVDAIPECAAGVHRGGGADGLPLTGPLDHGGLPLYAPGLAVHGIGTKPELIPKPDFAARGASLTGNGGEPLAPPVLDRGGIAPIDPLQRGRQRGL